MCVCRRSVCVFVCVRALPVWAFNGRPPKGLCGKPITNYRGPGEEWAFGAVWSRSSIYPIHSFRAFFSRLKVAITPGLMVFLECLLSADTKIRPSFRKGRQKRRQKKGRKINEERLMVDDVYHWLMIKQKSFYRSLDLKHMDGSLMW